MATFNLRQYIIRVVKYAIYLAVVFTLIVTIFSVTSPNKFDYTNLFREGTSNQLIIFLSAVSLIYPFFGFAKRKVYLNNQFNKDRDTIFEIFKNINYTLHSESNNELVFKATSPAKRLLRMYEDKITIDTSDNPIVLEGLRKDVYRVARAIEWKISEESKDS